MPYKIVIGILALACATVFNIWSGMLTFQIVDLVNERLTPDQQFSHFGWYWSKYQRLNAAYKSFYPDGLLLRNSRRLFFVACAFMAICAWALVFN